MSAARSAAGSLHTKVMRGQAPDQVVQALALAQAEQDLIARKILPPVAHFIARAELKTLKEAA